MNASVRSIVHPTDSSHKSIVAFAHALRIAVAAKCKLHVLHVAQDHDAQDVAGGEAGLPQVRRLLAQWGLLAGDDPPSAIAAKLGILVENVTLDRQDPADGILHFLNQHVCDLVVLATHGRDGLDHWLQGSIAETVFSRSAVPTLFVRHGARGFVDQVSGASKVRRALVPVDRSPVPYRAIEAARSLGYLLAGTDIATQLLHVGSPAPALHDTSNPVVIRYGNVGQTILDAAVEYDVDFICMASAGHHGMRDAVRGSTTEHVVRHAPCPVLAISAV